MPETYTRDAEHDDTTHMHTPLNQCGAQIQSASVFEAPIRTRAPFVKFRETLISHTGPECDWALVRLLCDQFMGASWGKPTSMAGEICRGPYGIHSVGSDGARVGFSAHEL